MLDFTPNTEQRMIADTMAQVLAGHGLPATTAPDPAALWQALAGLGMAGLPFAEAQGGAGLGVPDMVCALIEAGRFGADLPLLASVLLPALCLRHAGPDALPKDLVAALVNGQITLGAAVDDAPLQPLTVRAAPDGFVLAGRKVACLGADTAAHLVTTQDAVFLLPADTPGLHRERYSLVDGRGAADLQLDAVALPATAQIGDASLAALLRDAGALALAAEALGAMERINAMTLDHLKTRHQFGQPIGRFQVLQHMMVDMVHETEHLTSLVQLAAMECDTNHDDGSTADRRARAVSRLRRHLSNRIRPAAAAAIQLHGGIGMTAEYVLGSLVKRVLVADMLYGSADDHAARLRRLLVEETLQDLPA